MKCTSLLLAAMLPVVAVASEEASREQLDHEALRGDMQVTRLLGAEVQSSDGQAIGSVEDVILDMKGKVVSVIVQRDGDGEDMNGAVETAAGSTVASARDSREEAVNSRERPVRGDAAVGTRGASTMEPAANGAGAPEGDFAKADWSGVSFDAGDDVVRLRGSAGELQPVNYAREDDALIQDEVRASRLVGMEVNLTDEESFGEIEDVLINMDNGSASALVVDSMEFFDKERYALPVSLDNLNPEEEELTLEVTQQDLEAMGEFDMDEMNDPL